MLGRKREQKTPSKGAGKNPLPFQLGLLDIPDFDNPDDMYGNDDDDDDDADLEAELLALEAGIDIRKCIARPRISADGVVKRVEKQVRKPDNDSSDDDDVDENDPQLLAELGNLTGQRDRSEILRPAPPPPLARAPPNARTQPQQESKLPAVPSRINTAPPIAAQNPRPAPSAQRSLLSTLEERNEMYRVALNNAKSVGDNAKARRLERGLKTLESLLKSAKAGKDVNEEDIPLPVATGVVNATRPNQQLHFVNEPVDDSVGPPVPPRNRPSQISSTSSTRVAPLPVTPTELPQPQISGSKPDITTKLSIVTDTVMSPDTIKTRGVLVTRRDQYRQAALQAKAIGDKTLTVSYIKIAKQFDNVITALDQGQPVDLSGMPPPPQAVKQDTRVVNVTPPQQKMPEESHPLKSIKLDEVSPAASDRDDQSLFNAPPPPSNALDALQQRLKKYQSSLEEANSSGNERKARQMGRIVKQYESAIKSYKLGKPLNYEELPNPPGFAPIPGNRAMMAASAPTPPNINPENQTGQLRTPPAAINTEMASQNLPAKVAAQTTPTAPPKPVKTDAKNGPRAPQSLNEKQMASLVEGQKQFKTAALEAKKRGDIQAAKEYLRLAKGFVPMIQASVCGLPVNMDSLPTLPQVAQEGSDFEIVRHQDCQATGTHEELCAKLEKELVSQIEMCNRTLKHFVELGDVPNAKKFKTMLQHSKKDLDMVQYAQKSGNEVPKFHYESRTFSIVQCCTDLGDDELEVHIIRGINYSCPNPKEVDTYVKYDFPFPADNHQRDKTVTIRDTNSPEYNAVFKVAVNRKARVFGRIVKRHDIRFEVWSKGGFLRSDTLLGTVAVKLVALETKCVVHNSFDVMDNRKPIGGKLEVKLRVRDPFLNKEVETITEKWLVIGEQRNM